MEVFSYSGRRAAYKICNAMYEGESFKVHIKGWRVKLLKRSLPLYMEYVSPNRPDNKGMNFFKTLKFYSLFFLNVGFWGIIFTALGYKMNIDYYFEGESIFVLFQKGDKKTYEELMNEEK